MQIKTYIIDAFSTEQFKGNPAAVCLLEENLSEKTMLSIAKEFGYSETAFVLKKTSDSFSIRFYSPLQEIPLCGHATMASAKALFTEHDHLSNITFHTQSGETLLIIQKKGKIDMTFPLHSTSEYKYDDRIRKALGINKITNSQYNKFHNVLMFEIESSTELQTLIPNFSILRNIETSLSGVLVTARSDRKNIDYEYRYFFPWSGADEDPVTGAVQSFLAKYWTDKLNKTKMSAYQCSSRSGSMEIEVLTNSVVITSTAVIFLSGIINLES